MPVPETTEKVGRLSNLKLNPELFSPQEDELEFLKKQTSIDDVEKLKEHVISVQKSAWDVVNYGCIRSFGFTKLKISHYPIYESLLALGKARPDAIYLEFACCFGNDARKAVADGYPVQNVIASDLQKDFWELGRKLYRDTPETFPVPFVPGSVFDPLLIAPAAPFSTLPLTPRPILSTLTSLTPLQGHVAAVNASAFFHLFDKEEQIAAARALASLLSPIPGSMIFGSHSAMEETGYLYHTSRDAEVFCFNAEDWKKVWKDIFTDGRIEVDAILLKPENIWWEAENDNARRDDDKRRRIIWSVRRV